MKTKSTFFGHEVRNNIARNAATTPSGVVEKERLVREAAPWADLPLEQLWSRVFGPTINRSWMVWSNGHCPDCLKPVVMYDWKIDAVKRPWKLACQHCHSAFPKNDFKAFYESGLDGSGVFDHSKADRKLLFNTEHPDPADPLHMHGVDDGTGFVRDGNTWRFIGAYLVYGEWKQFILAAINALAAAYVVTGDRGYARRAVVLLDRVADVFPGFDYINQGLVYEKPLSAGYVSVWHDANMEQADLLIAYDQVFDAIAGDAELIDFLSAKAKQTGNANPKRTATDIQKNINERLIAEPLSHPEKIHANFPALHAIIVTTRAILGWENTSERASLYAYWADMLKRMSAIDGVTGEKGLQTYTHITLRWTAKAISLFMLADSGFIAEMVKRVPNFGRTFRFHIDTWCGDKNFYPNEGDAAWFGAPSPEYLGLGGLRSSAPSAGGVGKHYNKPIGSGKSPGAVPSMDRLIWELYGATGDTDFIRLLVQENQGKFEDAVFDLTLADNAGVVAQIKETLDREGKALNVSHCVNLEKWHLAILRSGQPGKQRAVWLDYDTGGLHAHQDGLNMGLIAKGLDLMPDAGYPPVQFGGWDTQKARWYYHTAAHNSVVVDGKTQSNRGYGVPLPGFTRVWSQTPTLKSVFAVAPALYGIPRYERSLLMVDLSDDDFYAVDLFHVVGGSDHAKFIHSTYSEMTTQGLNLAPGADFGGGTLLRNFKGDASPGQGWSADWKVQDKFNVLPEPRDIHLKYTDLTHGAQACTHEGWYVAGPYSSVEETWLPRIMLRRQGAPGLGSLFAGVFEPYVGKSNIASIKRLDAGTAPEASSAAIEVTLADGRRDVILYQHSGHADWKVKADGHAALIRYDAQGRVERVATSKAYHVEASGLELTVEAYCTHLEIVLDHSDPNHVKARAVSSDLCDIWGIEKLTFNGQNLLSTLQR